jgi:TonB family protein
METLQNPAQTRDHILSSDLARLCLPQEYQDADRRWAWVNSICCAFLLIGIVGLKPPEVHVKPMTEMTDVVPIIITPLEEPAKTEAPEPDQTSDVTPDAPVVATAVAADPTTATFAVPIKGPIALVPARFAAPPPRDQRPSPSNATKYSASVGDWGGHLLNYPPLAKRMGYQGKVVLLITVNPSGTVTSVQLKSSSGYKILDDAALDHVRKHLRLRNPPGEVRHHTLEVEFRLR